jgi:hypothetical protein
LIEALAQRVQFLETPTATGQAKQSHRPGRFQRGRQRDDAFADTYGNWLKAAWHK